jgi:hypothetical protein
MSRLGPRARPAHAMTTKAPVLADCPPCRATGNVESRLQFRQKTSSIVAAEASSLAPRAIRSNVNMRQVRVAPPSRSWAHRRFRQSDRSDRVHLGDAGRHRPRLVPAPDIDSGRLATVGQKCAHFLPNGRCWVGLRRKQSQLALGLAPQVFDCEHDLEH